MRHTGGIRIGWFHASWPFAKLSGDGNELRIKALFSGEYRFSPKQIISIEKTGSIPFLSQGIKINHIVKEYPENIIFYWGGSNSELLIKEIYNLGFHPEASSAAAPRRDGIPIKWHIPILLIAIWNLLFLVDIVRPSNINHKGIGPFSVLALIIVFLFSVALRFSNKVQAAILKPGRGIGEISPILYFLMMLTGFMAFFMGMMLFAENF